jgi:hypothetical protein
MPIENEVTAEISGLGDILNLTVKSSDPEFIITVQKRILARRCEQAVQREEAEQEQKTKQGCSL